MNRRTLFIGTSLSFLLSLLISLALIYTFYRIAQDLPRLPTNPRELGIRPGTEIYAASGERIYTFNQNRQWVPLERINHQAIQALIATEDEDFFHHRGIDLKAIAGAARDNLLRGYRSRGGSTLTQQLVKRLFFSPRKNLRRKLSEALLALQVEALFAATYPGRNAKGTPVYKDRLLELYLNQAFYGANAYGIHDAAATYFSTTPDALSLPRAALLMGLINAPLIIHSATPIVLHCAWNTFSIECSQAAISTLLSTDPMPISRPAIFWIRVEYPAIQLPIGSRR